MLRKLRWLLVLGLVCGWLLPVNPVHAQDDAVPEGTELAEGAAADEEDDGSVGFFKIVFSGGIMGIILWLALFGSSIAGVALIVDSFITVREKKIAPETLAENVRESMEQGDVMKALGHCEEEPGPLATILSAGFSNVQEGFEVVQDAITVAADRVNRP